MTDATTDWNPETYARFRGLRLRPALDLLAQVGDVPKGDIVDLGCGNGAVAAALATRFSGRRIVGVDQSAAMLAEAGATGLYWRLEEADIAAWEPQDATALIFSNAALQWVGSHEVLLPRLLAFLPAGGMLAVQMPRQYAAPSHRFLRDIAAARFPGRFDFADYVEPVWPAEWYWTAACGLRRGERLGDAVCAAIAACRRGSSGAALHREPRRCGPSGSDCPRPKLQDFVAAYDEALAAAYPLRPDGSVLLPFLRVFFTVRV